MSKPKRVSLVLTAIPFLLIIGLLTRSQSAYNASRKSEPLQLVNKTQSLEVTAKLAEDKQRHLLQLIIRLRNTSTRACTGYVISFGDGHQRYGTDLEKPEHYLQQGESRTESLDPANVVTEDGHLKLITIETGLFDDDSIEGNERLGIERLDWRFGQAIQLAKFRTPFEKLLGLPVESLPDAIKKLESEIDALSTSYDDSYGRGIGDNAMRRMVVETGMKDGKQTLRYEIESLKNGWTPRWKPNVPLSDAEKQAMISLAQSERLTSIGQKCKRAADQLERSRRGYPSEKTR